MAHTRRTGKPRVHKPHIVGLNEDARLKEQWEETRAQLLKYGGIFLAVVLGVVGLVFMVVRMSADTKEDFLARGDALVEDRLYDEAVNEYLNALKLDSDYGDARRQLAKAYDGQGDQRKALGESLRAAELLPGDVDAQLVAASLLLQARQFEDADTHASRAVTLAPTNVTAQIVKAASIARIRELSRGVLELEPATRLELAEFRPYLLMRAMAGGTGGLPAGEAAFRKAAEGAPASVAAQQALGAYYWLTGRPDDAEVWLRKAVETDPTSLESQRKLAAYLVAVGRAPEAEAPLKRFAETTRTSSAQIALADYYVGQGRIEEARALLDAATRDTDAFPPAKVRLARIDHSGGRQPEGHRGLAEALAKNSKQIDALILRVQFFLAERKIEEALQAAQAAIVAAPFSGEARASFGEVRANRGQLDDAIVAFNEALELDPGLFAAKVRLIQVHIQTGDAKLASQLADEMVRDVPLSVGARLLRSQARIALDDLGGAEGDVTEILTAIPTMAPAHALMGEIFVRRGNAAAARREFDRALELDPLSIQALRGHVALDLADKRPDRARTAIERGLQVSPSDPALLGQAARVYQALGDVDKAEAALNTLINLEPSNLDAFTSLTSLYADNKRLDQALSRFGTISLGPAAVGAQTMAGLILEALKQPDDARVVYERLLASKPSDAAVASNSLARLYVAAGDKLDVALELASAATRRRPATPQFNHTLGWVHLQKGDASAAVPPLEISVKAEPADPQSRYHLGLAYLKTGRHEKAVEQLAVALKLRPGDRDTQLAMTEATAVASKRAGG
jgi:tetratricopeptide (TPR) repeat protein